MELIKVNALKPVSPTLEFAPVAETSDIHFMAANTKPVTLSELQQRHTIPVFAKNNENTISHQELIETVALVTEKIFGGKTILKPAVRVSHPIKGKYSICCG